MQAHSLRGEKQMSNRPSYLVIIPKDGLFSAHWTEGEAFQVVEKLISAEIPHMYKPYVVEVPETDGISPKWTLCHTAHSQNPDEEPQATPSAQQTDQPA